jgi:hypothetical protein
MRRSMVVAILFLSFQLPAVSQHGGRHSTSSGTSGTGTPSEDPDLTTFKHAVAEQATDEQVAQFRLMTKSTEAARRQAHDLQDQSSKPGNSADPANQANALESSVEQALSDTQTFRRSFTDSQEATLKVQAKKLTKSDTAVSKSAKGLSQQLERTTADPSRLKHSAPNLEKELETLQSDQLALGKQMGIQSQ